MHPDGRIVLRTTQSLPQGATTPRSHPHSQSYHCASRVWCLGTLRPVQPSPSRARCPWCLAVLRDRPTQVRSCCDQHHQPRASQRGSDLRDFGRQRLWPATLVLYCPPPGHSTSALSPVASCPRYPVWFSPCRRRSQSPMRPRRKPGMRHPCHCRLVGATARPRDCVCPV